ncbi:MAG: hypothetical protein COB76_04185 [Alphaproteobacteria bacterium]|nr:MAG: hypothetical protein COB76_04185 [Alphaproteobacteria bacterium]
MVNINPTQNNNGLNMPLKIAYLSPSTLFSGKANAVHVMKMCQAFTKNNAETTLFAQCQKPLDKNEAFQFYDVTTKFDINIISTFNISKIKTLTLGYKSARKAKAISSDIAYSRLISGAFFACLMGIKSVLEIHSKPNIYERIFLKQIVKSKFFLGIVVISSPLKDMIVDIFSISPEKIFIHHDGADITDHSHIKIPYKSDNNAPNIAYIGSLYKGRGIDVITQIAQMRPAYNFHIIGKINDIDTQSTPPNMKFHGAVPFKHTEAFRHHADILIAPYQSSVRTSSGDDTTRWMSPLKIFEYMGSKTPFICSELPALQDIVTHGHDCLMCPANATKKWADSIDMLLSDPDLTKKLSGNAFQKFCDHYTWEKRAKNILQDIRQFL